MYLFIYRSYIIYAYKCVCMYVCNWDGTGFKLFQVDDGYQTAWGDWADLKYPEFPCRSLAPLVERIKQAGKMIFHNKLFLIHIITHLITVLT